MAIDFAHPFTSISNPRLLPDGKILLDAILEGEAVTFVADAADVTSYGPLIHAAALAGEFGVPGIAPAEG